MLGMEEVYVQQGTDWAGIITALGGLLVGVIGALAAYHQARGKQKEAERARDAAAAKDQAMTAMKVFVEEIQKMRFNPSVPLRNETTDELITDPSEHMRETLVNEIQDRTVELNIESFVKPIVREVKENLRASG